MLRQYVSNGALLSDLMVPKYQQYPELEGLFRELVAISEDLQDLFLLDKVKGNEAEWYLERGEYATAIEILTELIELTDLSGDQMGRAQNTLSLGKALLLDGKAQMAIPYLKESEALCTAMGLEAEQSKAQKLLSASYEQSGDLEQSLAYYKAYSELDKMVYSQNRTQRFDELQTIYETKQKEHAIALQEQTIAALNADAKANRVTRMVYGIGMLSFLLMSVLIAIIYRQKMKKAALERDQQEAQFQQEIAFKKKELASQTLHLVQKNTFIQELKEKLDSIKASPDLFKVEFNRIVSLLHRQSAEDENWEVFKSYFSEVHNNFDINLKSVAPDITENEMRLASFLRMNLTIKEIASMLHVQPESIMKSKYRLKKKLGLVKADDLDNYLASL
jgi:tetratricopeptide (TPR) repeat protein